MTCIHLAQKGEKRVCIIGKYKGSPTEKNCLDCTDYEGPSRGLGDTVKNVINKATGGKVKPCGACNKRRTALNKAVGYKKKEGT